MPVDAESRHQSKATDVLIDLLKTAIHSGHSAKYVLFDTWFSTPKTICQIKNDCKLDVIAMIKKSSRIKYEWNNQKLDVKEIYSRNKKRRGRSKYLLSVPVNITTKDDKGTQISIPAKIVYVRNAKKKKDWIALISTNTELSEEDIIRIYGKRWQTEVFYKTCKSWLKLGKECHGLSYDALTAHVSLVFTRYMLISIEQRKSEDSRSICEIFYVLCDELADITYNESMRIIVEAMLDSIRSIFHITNNLKNSLQISLTGCQNTCRYRWVTHRQSLKVYSIVKNIKFSRSEARFQYGKFELIINKNGISRITI